ncbi:hypothetical protein DFQ27_001434 [Actinomortierella ambigua]|uniref:Uncharacterized protein n=1 Tax=Actinomortierella ambigua TaxID=1343610 RepID=A0A9P6U7L9_9FUNG|nr:hypothetical protein DFQ27_001434 [Actinomortierella ambigua]
MDNPWGLVPKASSTIMPLFKNNKNKTASAAPSPAQTPRTSLQATRPTAAEDQMAKGKISKNAASIGIFNSMNLLI